MTDRIPPGADGADLGDDDDEEYEIVTLVDDEDGSERNFVKLDEIEIDGQSYGLFVAEDDLDAMGDDDTDEARDPETLVLRIEGEEYLLIEDDDELTRVAARLEALAAEAEGLLGQD